MTNVPFIVLGTIFVAGELHIGRSVFLREDFGPLRATVLKLYTHKRSGRRCSVNYTSEIILYTPIIEFSTKVYYYEEYIF